MIDGCGARFQAKSLFRVPTLSGRSLRQGSWSSKGPASSREGARHQSRPAQKSVCRPPNRGQRGRRSGLCHSRALHRLDRVVPASAHGIRLAPVRNRGRDFDLLGYDRQLAIDERPVSQPIRKMDLRGFRRSGCARLTAGWEQLDQRVAYRPGAALGRPRIRPVLAAPKRCSLTTATDSILRPLTDLASDERRTIPVRLFRRQTPKRC
jgi:hypothetical protein